MNNQIEKFNGQISTKLVMVKEKTTEINTEVSKDRPVNNTLAGEIDNKKIILNNIKTRLVETKEETIRIQERINNLKEEVEIMTKINKLKDRKPVDSMEIVRYEQEEFRKRLEEKINTGLKKLEGEIEEIIKKMNKMDKND
jgi:hypothetical protein